MYCGIDIIEVDRIKKAVVEDKGFKERVFSKKEIADIDKCAEKVRYQRYAGRFAAKEAIYKAISKILIENNMTIEFNEIEVENVEKLKRRPKLNILNSEINKVLKDYSIDISISHIEKMASAQCVVEKRRAL